MRCGHFGELTAQRAWIAAALLLIAALMNAWTDSGVCADGMWVKANCRIPYPRTVEGLSDAAHEQHRLSGLYHRSASVAVGRALFRSLLQRDVKRLARPSCFVDRRVLPRIPPMFKESGSGSTVMPSEAAGDPGLRGLGGLTLVVLSVGPGIAAMCGELVPALAVSNLPCCRINAGAASCRWRRVGGGVAQLWRTRYSPGPGTPHLDLEAS